MHKTVKLVGIMVALSVATTFAADWPWVYGPLVRGQKELKALRIAE